MKIVVYSVAHGENTVELSDEVTRVGHQVLWDEGGVLDSHVAGVTVFVEHPYGNRNPVLVYVRRHPDRSFDFEGASRVPLKKTKVRRIIR